ncbi:hypothetical protein BDQ17DRAFT_1432231 [Cyathus striatus]|nr:hypothetical protein BDQ17DRAFT_1432231 [Cyathus striatus]
MTSKTDSMGDAIPMGRPSLLAGIHDSPRWLFSLGLLQAQRQVEYASRFDPSVTHNEEEGEEEEEGLFHAASDPFSDNNRHDPRFFDYVPCGNITATHAEGTGALYFSTGGSSGAVCIFTARQVVLPFKDSNNKLYDQGGGERKTDGFEATRAEIECSLRMKGSMKELNRLRSVIAKFWSQEQHYIIDRLLMPLLLVSVKALIELDHEKFNWSNFRGNMGGLGTDMMVYKFVYLMQPYAFIYPMYYYNCLFLIQGVILEVELTRP